MIVINTRRAQAIIVTRKYPLPESKYMSAYVEYEKSIALYIATSHSADVFGP